jgi:GNAT superfamily N-acetyltransferase
MRKISKPDGSKVLVTADGTRYPVPPGIRIIPETEASFKLQVQAAVMQQVNAWCTEKGGCDLHVVSVPKVGSYKMWFTKKGHPHVMLEGPDGPMAWAFFARKRNSLIELAAAVHPKFQGKGVYGALLRHLKQYVAPVILSDQTLTTANALQWMRHGTYAPKHRRFKLNPKGRRPTAAAFQAAIRALYTRDLTR